jgi:hypothetical protein
MYSNWYTSNAVHVTALFLINLLSFDSIYCSFFAGALKEVNNLDNISD